MTRAEAWLPFLQNQIDFCTQSGCDALISREYMQEEDKQLHYYTLNAKKSNREYVIRLIEHELTKEYGHDRFKVVINAQEGKNAAYLTAIKRDFYTLVDNIPFQNLRSHPQILSRNNAEKTLNLLVAIPVLFKNAIESMQQTQKKRMAELEEQKKRISGKEIPEIL